MYYFYDSQINGVEIRTGEVEIIDLFSVEKIQRGLHAFGAKKYHGFEYCQASMSV